MYGTKIIFCTLKFLKISYRNHICNYKSLLLKVDGPAGADRHVEIPRAINVGAFSMAHQKAPQKVVIATEFKVLKPKGVSQHTDLFRIVDNKNDTEVFDIN